MVFKWKLFYEPQMLTPRLIWESERSENIVCRKRKNIYRAITRHSLLFNRFRHLRIEPVNGMYSIKLF
jgi:hypothetical protein